MPAFRPRRPAPALLTAALALALAATAPVTRAAEGMWTLDNLPLADMKKAYGFSPDQAWVDKVMRASARLAGGCSASFVSKDGLVLTNHHCVEECLSELSTPEKDLRHLGFLAPRREDERVCPGMELNRLEQITDVTAEFGKATLGKTGRAYTDAVNATKARLESACVAGEKASRRCDVVTLYQGGRRHLYRYHRFQDVRLAFAPEVEIAAFGGDPDNFNFPRYDLDMGLLRAYEGGKPAPAADFFAWNAQGAEPGELVMTSGHPGRTQRQYTVAQLERLRDIDLPASLLRLSEERGYMNRYATEGQEQDRLAQEELRWIENSFKVLYGQLEALRDPVVFERKKKEEAELRHLAASRADLRAEAGAWDEIAKAEAAYRNLQLRLRFTERAQGFNTGYFSLARTLVRGAAERAKPDAERLPEFSESNLPRVEAGLFADAPIYPGFEKIKLAWSLVQMRQWLGADDALVRQVLGRESTDGLAARLVDDTGLADMATRKALWTGGLAAIQASKDPFIQLALAVDAESRQWRQRMENEVSSVETKNAERIARVRFALSGTKAYPDATFSLRLSHGVVAGWNDHGREVPPFTMMAGAFDRATGSDPFKLPASWLGAQKAGVIDPKQRFNFVTTNDIIGGNSGSPMINARAELVGLAFDGNLDSLGGAYLYDGRVNRTVGVHSGGMLHVMNTVYHADALVQELKAGAVKR